MHDAPSYIKILRRIPMLNQCVCVHMANLYAFLVLRLSVWVLSSSAGGLSGKVCLFSAMQHCMKSAMGIQYRYTIEWNPPVMGAKHVGGCIMSENWANSAICTVLSSFAIDVHLFNLTAATLPCMEKQLKNRSGFSGWSLCICNHFWLLSHNPSGFINPNSLILRFT